MVLSSIHMSSIPSFSPSSPFLLPRPLSSSPFPSSSPPPPPAYHPFLFTLRSKELFQTCMYLYMSVPWIVQYGIIHVIQCDSPPSNQGVVSMTTPWSNTHLHWLYSALFTVRSSTLHFHMWTVYKLPHHLWIFRVYLVTGILELVTQCVLFTRHIHIYCILCVIYKQYNIVADILCRNTRFIR